MQLPMSIGQQGLWYLCQADETTSAAYNVCTALIASSTPDFAQLQHALDTVALRHPLLCARIIEDDGLPCFEHTGRTSGITQAQGNWQQIASAESGIGFDFMQGPLYRATLVQDQAQACSALILVFSHLVFDGPSLNIFLQELSAVCSGTELLAADLGAKQGHYVERESQFIESDFEAQEQSCTAQIVASLQGMPEALNLPQLASAAMQASYPAAQCCVALSPALSTALGALAQQQATTPAALYIAVLQVLLAQYSQQHQFILNLPVSNRDSGEEKAIGYYTNLGVLAAKLAPNMDFLSLLEQVADQIYDLLDTRQVPFPTLVRSMKNTGMNNVGSLMQIAFNHQKQACPTWQIAGVAMHSAGVAMQYAKNAFKLEIEEGGSSTRCSLIYARDQFEAGIMQRMLTHYVTLLEMAVAKADTLLQDFPLLSATEQQQLFGVEAGAWNATHAEFPRDLCIHDLLTAQAARTPQALAISAEDGELSYAELEQRANQLASYLQHHGAQPDTLVAICMERGLDMVVAMLATLKAGAAYLPLDPAYPVERLRYTLGDAQPTILLTQQALLAQLTASPTASATVSHTVCLDSTWWQQQPLCSAPVTRVTPHHLAYCIYTSGSTGQPKGVALTHHNAVNFLTWARHTFSVEDLSRTVFSTSICFDLSVFELFAPLTCGGSVILVKNAMALLHDARISTASLLNTVPSVMPSLLDAKVCGPTLRVLNLAGEALQPSLASRILQEMPAVTLFNLYGPTEYTTYTTGCKVVRAAQVRVTLGRPLANTRIYLLNEALQAVPPGIAGEIYIAGDGLARGYLNRPALTAERFMPDPFGAAGSRMYKTGDLARYLADGQLEFLGRLDHQVKIHGFRIELGEIENALLQHASVREAVLLAREDEPGEKRLVAYLSCDGTPPTLDALRQHLRVSLPEFMLPAAWVILDALPLTPNRKIDRAALPAPSKDSSEADTREQRAVPSTATEQLLAGIWCEELKLTNIGADDNFFVLGGHSLLAMKVLARLRQQLALTIPMRTLLDAPTIALFAKQIELLQNQTSSSPASTTSTAIPTIARQARRSSPT